MHRFSICSAIALALVATTAQAGPILSFDQTPVNIGALELAPDGLWMQGRDYDYDENGFWVNELWVGGLGSSVMLTQQATVDVARGDGNSFPIDLNKNVDNESGLFWEFFVIDLIPQGNDSIENVQAFPNSSFGDVQVMTAPDGQVTITFTQGAGTGVSPGADVDLNITFDILSPDLNLDFDMVQTYIPEPASLSLLALGGLAMIRRRR